MWNLQSYPTTVLNKRMWRHFRGSKHTLTPPTYFQESRPLNLPGSMTLCTLSEYGNTNNSRKTFIASERATQVLRTFHQLLLTMVWRKRTLPERQRIDTGKSVRVLRNITSYRNPAVVLYTLHRVWNHWKHCVKRWLQLRHHCDPTASRLSCNSCATDRLTCVELELHESCAAVAVQCCSWVAAVSHSTMHL